MNENRWILSKEEINNRFLIAVQELLRNRIVSNKAALAEAFGIKPAKFSEILNGRMKAGVDMLAILCDYYYISSEWLLSGKGEMLNEAGRIVDTPALPVHDMASINPVTHIAREQPAQDTAAAGLIEKLLDRITEQAAEIGRLQEQICQMRQRFEKDAANVNTDTTASVG